MKTMWKKGVLALATGASLVAMAAPAEARGYYRGGYGYRHHGNGGAAIAGGILGLAVGAAIASNAGRGGYGDRSYYRGGGYGYVDDGYYRGYDRPYRYRGGYQRCTTERYWDDYRGGWTTIQRCD